MTDTPEMSLQGEWHLKAAHNNKKTELNTRIKPTNKQALKKSLETLKILKLNDTQRRTK